MSFRASLTKAFRSAMSDIEATRRSYSLGAAMRSVAHLGAAAVLSRVITASGYVLVARLYAPADFGIFAVYLAAVILFTPISAGLYDRAIAVERSERRAFNLVVLSVAVSLAAMAAMMGGIALLAGMDKFVAMLSAPEVLTLIWYIPLAVLLRALYRPLEQWAVWRGQFRGQANATMSQAIVQTSAQAALAFAPLAGSLALMLADLLGALAALVMMGLFQYRSLREAAGRQGRKLNLWRTARRWAQMPRFSMPSMLILMLSQNAPVLLFGASFSPHVVGQIAMALRMLELPYQLVLASLTNVAYHRIAADNAERRPEPFRRVSRQLLFAAIVIYGAAAILAGPVIPWVLGEPWSEAAYFLTLLSPHYLGLFATTPLLFIYTLSRSERRAFGFRLGLLAAVLIGWAAVWLTGDPVASLLVFALAGGSASMLALIDMNRLAADTARGQRYVAGSRRPWA